MITITARLRKESTGEIRPYTYTIPGNPDGTFYLWTEGNYSCDCNRELFWTNHNPNCPNPCGDERYTLVGLTLDGVEVDLNGYR